MLKSYVNDYNKNLHIQKNDFIKAVNKAQNIKELCEILKKSKPSVYTYANRFGVALQGRYITQIRKADGYYHYTNSKNHRKIMEKYLGRKLDSRKEQIHHIDRNKLNNEIENLLVLSVSDHMKLHGQLESLLFELYNRGMIIFNRESKRYEFNQ